jgi:hypothetical protein
MDIVILTEAIKGLVPNKPFTVYWATKEGTVSDFQTLKFEDETITNPSDDDIVAEYNRLKDIKEAEAQAKIDLKASAKAKLIAGEALTEDEANTIVL